MKNNVIPFNSKNRVPKPAMDYYTVIGYMFEITDKHGLSSYYTNTTNPFTEDFIRFRHSIKWLDIPMSQRRMLSLGVLVSRIDEAWNMLAHLGAEYAPCIEYGERVLQKAMQDYIIPAQYNLTLYEGHDDWIYGTGFNRMHTDYKNETILNWKLSGLHYVYEQEEEQPIDGSEWLLWLPIGEIAASLYGIELSLKTVDVIARTPIWYFLTEYRRYYESIGIKFRDVLS